MEAWPRRPRATAGGDCGGASARFGGGQGVGQKHEGTLGARFPRSPWVGMERGDSAMVACGSGLWSSVWRRCGARKEGVWWWPGL